jgi:hypothetical protein
VELESGPHAPDLLQSYPVQSVQRLPSFDSLVHHASVNGTKFRKNSRSGNGKNDLCSSSKPFCVHSFL